MTPAKLPRLDEVVALILAGEGEPALTRRLNDGTLHRARSRWVVAANFVRF